MKDEHIEQSHPAISEQWLDAVLNGQPPANVRMHLKQCVDCQARLERHRAFLQALGSLPQKAELPLESLLPPEGEIQSELPDWLRRRLKTIPQEEPESSEENGWGRLTRWLSDCLRGPQLRWVAGTAFTLLAVMILLPSQVERKKGSDELASGRQLSQRALQLELVSRDDTGALKRLDPVVTGRGDSRISIESKQTFLPVLVLDDASSVVLEPWHIAALVADKEGRLRILYRSAGPIQLEPLADSRQLVPLPEKLQLSRSASGPSSLRLYVLLTREAPDQDALASIGLTSVDPALASDAAAARLLRLVGDGHYGTLSMELK